MTCISTFVFAFCLGKVGRFWLKWYLKLHHFLTWDRELRDQPGRPFLQLANVGRIVQFRRPNVDTEHLRDVIKARPLRQESDRERIPETVRMPFLASAPLDYSAHHCIHTLR